MQHRIPAAFFRGGTSKGLFLRPSALSRHPLAIRESIILSALGSPDPDGRQIDGLGGGISSLSKVAICGVPGEDGMEWLDHPLNDDKNVDVVYRFGQVSVRKPEIDWSTTCGNLVAAVGQFAVDTLLPQPKLQTLYRQHNGIIPVRILSANTNGTIIAKVPAVTAPNHAIVASSSGTTSISGVPGTAAGIEIAFLNPAGSLGVLPTGRRKDVITLPSGESVSISIINAGLPTVFLPITALPFPSSYLTQESPSTLDQNADLHSLLEHIRSEAARLLNSPLTPSLPKIAFLADPTRYTTTSNTTVHSEDMDVLARAISVGNVHRTFPATCLMALAAGANIPGTAVSDAVRNKKGKWVRVGHPAGVAEAGADVFQPETSGVKLESVGMVRTARRIMDGEVLVPHFS
ncbi:hypothetical protein HDU85_007236 [Gaertneriomyces sp. JEL0708]|nr:hypothetical protein HDU85_007236 [Gaertneriomyces sp. JEL0708]